MASATTTTISVSARTDQVTLINVFTVDPTRQTELADSLSNATDQIFVDVPGFISANLHTGLDRAPVINYAQWAHQELYAEAMERDDVREHLTTSAAIADTCDPTLVQVQSIHHGGRA